MTKYRCEGGESVWGDVLPFFLLDYWPWFIFLEDRPGVCVHLVENGHFYFHICNRSCVIIFFQREKEQKKTTTTSFN